MPAPRQRIDARHARRRKELRAARRARLFAVLSLLGLVLVVTLLLTAFGSGRSARVASTSPVPADRLLPTGPPSSEIVATQGALNLQLPVPQRRVTAIGYHAAGDGALALKPVGSQRNEGLLSRAFHKVFGGGDSGLHWYQVDGGSGPSTGALDVGAPSGTDVYSPVDGTVVGLTDFVINGRRYGSRVDVQPAAAPSLIVSLTHVAPDAALTVGSGVSAGTSKLGTLLDLARVERQSLARYTQDAGNHVQIEVRAAGSLSLP
jgi:murein DD-endopeptidase MepM/ murein hydrolase activator NlpD